MVILKQNKKKGRSRSNQNKKLRSPLIVVLMGGLCLIIAAVIVASIEKKSSIEMPIHIADKQSIGSENTAANKHRDLLKLIGRWVRTDGGYVIEIKNVDTEGKMEAFYYNPRPINVAVAKALWANNGSKVFIELQDVGYPGSTYSLDYDPFNDTLTGSYFQAVIKQGFDVVFTRIK